MEQGQQDQLFAHAIIQKLGLQITSFEELKKQIPEGIINHALRVGICINDFFSLGASLEYDKYLSSAAADKILSATIMQAYAGYGANAEHAVLALKNLMSTVGFLNRVSVAELHKQLMFFGEKNHIEHLQALIPHVSNNIDGKLVDHFLSKSMSWHLKAVAELLSSADIKNAVIEHFKKLDLESFETKLLSSHAAFTVLCQDEMPETMDELAQSYVSADDEYVIEILTTEKSYEYMMFVMGHVKSAERFKAIFETMVNSGDVRALQINNAAIKYQIDTGNPPLAILSANLSQLVKVDRLKTLKLSAAEETLIGASNKVIGILSEYSAKVLQDSLSWYNRESSAIENFQFMIKLVKFHKHTMLKLMLEQDAIKQLSRYDMLVEKAVENKDDISCELLLNKLPVVLENLDEIKTSTITSGLQKAYHTALKSKNGMIVMKFLDKTAHLLTEGLITQTKDEGYSCYLPDGCPSQLSFHAAGNQSQQFCQQLVYVQSVQAPSNAPVYGGGASGVNTPPNDTIPETKSEKGGVASPQGYHIAQTVIGSLFLGYDMSKLVRVALTTTATFGSDYLGYQRTTGDKVIANIDGQKPIYFAMVGVEVLLSAGALCFQNQYVAEYSAKIVTALFAMMLFKGATNGNAPQTTKEFGIYAGLSLLSIPVIYGYNQYVQPYFDHVAVEEQKQNEEMSSNEDVRVSGEGEVYQAEGEL